MPLLYLPVRRPPASADHTVVPIWYFSYIGLRSDASDDLKTERRGRGPTRVVVVTVKKEKSRVGLRTPFRPSAVCGSQWPY